MLNTVSMLNVKFNTCLDIKFHQYTSNKTGAKQMNADDRQKLFMKFAINNLEYTGTRWCSLAYV
jgi:hypothetical protein